MGSLAIVLLSLATIVNTFQVVRLARMVYRQRIDILRAQVNEALNCGVRK